MKHIVLKEFRDAHTGRIMIPGQAIVETDHLRIQALADSGFIAMPIELVDVDPVDQMIFPHHVGGAYYELSNGEKVKGKEAAEEAEKALKEVLIAPSDVTEPTVSGGDLDGDT
ncbi:hypothetical protein QE450_000842 [Paenibacillus sp. SORGH_AS306]|uniref:hypothetical protein n=1 Tax=unclassified Paenibacillus TaxID=185978 RepID=UPI0027804449|nr:MULTISPECIES: hypothetical protein [unclassified Paenibacillus]MDQ1233344.1 hypothetical protein [Paenibacillus sp. SORGH_AS_0306]MDR6110385.1 hypothetical protein [Paenibacillus sp. SORGH_AS_0338]